LSEQVNAILVEALKQPDDPGLPNLMALCRRVLRVSDRRRSIPRCLVPVA
jgi:hypothetical protein